MTKRSTPPVAYRENPRWLRGVRKDGSRRSLPSRSVEKACAEARAAALKGADTLNIRVSTGSLR
jgi:hypothetical protein